MLAVTTVVGVVAVVAAVSLPSAAQQREVDAADRAAARYGDRLDAAVATFTDQVRRDVSRHTSDVAVALRLVRRHVASVPRLTSAGTTAYGREHSAAFRTARGRRGLVLRPFAELTKALEVARAAQEFIAAGTAAIHVNPVELLDGVPAVTGDALRDRVVPAFRAARDRLDDHPAPSGSTLLGTDLRTYLTDAIRSTRGGADDIDAGRAFHFELGTKPADLERRLGELQRTVVAGVLQALDQVTGYSGEAGATPSV